MLVFGKLDSYSAFKFVNYIQTMKKMTRKSTNPIEQIENRLQEEEHRQIVNDDLMFNQIFSFSTQYPNNYCLICDQILKITEPISDFVKGYFIINLTNFFIYPIPSSNFSIYRCCDEIVETNLEILKSVKYKIRQ